MVRACVILFTIGTLAMGQAMVQHAAAAAGGAAAAAGSAKVAEGLANVLGAAAGSAATAATPVQAAQVPAARHGKPSPFAAQVNRSGGSVPAPAVVPPPAAVSSEPVPAPGEVETMATGEAARGNMWTPRNPHPSAVVPFSPYTAGEGGGAVRSSAHRLSGNPPQFAGVAPVISATTAMIAAPVVPPPPPPSLATPEKFAAIKQGDTAQNVIAELGTPAAKIAMFEEGKLVESWRIEVRGQKIGTVMVTDGVVTSIEPVAR